MKKLLLLLFVPVVVEALVLPVYYPTCFYEGTIGSVVKSNTELLKKTESQLISDKSEEVLIIVDDESFPRKNYDYEANVRIEKGKVIPSRLNEYNFLEDVCSGSEILNVGLNDRDLGGYILQELEGKKIKVISSNNGQKSVEIQGSFRYFFVGVLAFLLRYWPFLFVFAMISGVALFLRRKKKYKYKNNEKLLLLLLMPGITFAFPVLKPTCEVRVRITELYEQHNSKCVWVDRYSEGFLCSNGFGAGRDVLVEIKETYISQNSNKYARGTCEEDYPVGSSQEIYIETEGASYLVPGMIIKGTVSYRVLKINKIEKSLKIYFYGLKDFLIPFGDIFF